MKYFLFKLSDESQLVEQPRAEFKGQKRISPITGLPEPYYPTWKRRIKMYCVSFPLLILCLLFAVFGMWLYLDFQQILKNRYENETGFMVGIIMHVPSVLYGAAIFLLNNAYSSFAAKLNDWGEYSTVSIILCLYSSSINCICFNRLFLNSLNYFVFRYINTSHVRINRAFLLKP